MTLPLFACAKTTTFAGRKRAGLFKTLATGTMLGLSVLAGAGCNPASTAVKPAPTATASIPSGQSIGLQQSVSWSSTSFKGNFHDTLVDLSIKPNWTTREIRGTVDAKPVSLDVQAHWGGYLVTGTFQGNPVSLEIHNSLGKQTMTGTFAAKAVNLTSQNGLSLSSWTGSVDGAPVNLASEASGMVDRMTYGTFAGKPLSFKTDKHFASADYHADSPSEKTSADDLLLTMMTLGTIRYSSGKSSHLLINF